jgi:hypothetical protein
MGLGLTLILAFGYGLGAWYAQLPDKLSMQKYIPQITFTGEQSTNLQPVAAGATGCASIQSSLKGEYIAPKVWAYTCQSGLKESSPADGQLVLNLSTSDPNLELIAGGSACDVHWFQGGKNLRYSGACFSNITRFSGGGASLSAANGMWYVMGLSGAATACTIQVKLNGVPNKCECVYSSYGSVSAPPCSPSNNPNATAPPAATPTTPPARTTPLTIPEILKQGTACGEHTESDYTCSKDRLSHTVRHVKYCENGSQKFVTLGCNGAGETRQWEDMTAEVQANQGKYASTMGGCESLNLNCPPASNATAPTQPPVPTSTPLPTATPTPVIIPPTAVPTAPPTPTPAIPTSSPPLPVSSQGVLQITPLSADSTYYLSFVTTPGDVAFGLYFANGTDISLENQINAALAQQGISIPTFKSQTANAYLYDLPFLINNPSTRLSFTLYRRPKKDNTLPVTLSTFIEQSKGCLSTVMPNTYVIDITSIQANSPCR